MNSRKIISYLPGHYSVIEENTLYHSTTLYKDQSFTSFEKRKAFRSGMMGVVETIPPEWVFLTEDFELAKQFGSAKTEDIVSRTRDRNHKTAILKVDVNLNSLNILDLSTDDFEDILEDQIGLNLWEYYDNGWSYDDPQKEQMWSLLDDLTISNLIKKRGFNCVKLYEHVSSSYHGITYAVDIDKQDRLLKIVDVVRK